MKKRPIFFLIILLTALSIGIGFSIFYLFKAPTLKKHKKTEVIIPQTDTNEDLDVVRALLLFHAADYFVYRGAPIGFQYNMLKELEVGLGRNIDIKIETDVNKMKKELF